MASVTGVRGVFYALMRLYKCSKVTLGYKPAYVVSQGVYDESVYPRHDGLKIIALSCINAKMTRFCYPHDEDNVQPP